MRNLLRSPLNRIRGLLHAVRMRVRFIMWMRQDSPVQRCNRGDCCPYSCPWCSTGSGG